MPTLGELLGKLPSPGGQLALVPGSHVAIRHGEPNARFVEPSLREIRPLGPGASVVLLDAAAAVGKSTLLSEIAHRMKAPVCDLGQMNVGSYSLLGSLVDAYGAGQLAQVLDGLSKGTFLLLLDALDEAELRAGSHNFDAFLTHLCQMFQAEGPRPTLVVSARKETADLLMLYFDEHAVSYSTRWILRRSRQAAGGVISPVIGETTAFL